MPGVSLETIHANHGYAGTSFVDSEATLFDGASLCFSTLSAWLNLSGLKIAHRSQGGVDVSWDQPAQFICKISDATISTGFGLNSASGSTRGQISLEEIPEFSVGEFGALTAGQIHSRFVWPLVALMTFASDGPPSLDQFRLFKDEKQSRFDRLYSPAVKPNEPQPTTGRDLLFTRDDLADDFESFIRKWFAFVNANQQFCTVFFSQGYEKHGFLESRFMPLMQAAECLVLANVSDHSEILNPFEHAFQSLQASESLAKFPFAFATLPSATQIALPTLFAKLISDNWALVERVVGTAQDRFLKALFATFNQVMHRVTLSADAISGTGGYWLQARLAAVIKIVVLKQLEFSDTQIIEIIGRNAQLSHLTNSKIPWDSRTESE